MILLCIKVWENWPWNLTVAYGFATAEAKSKQRGISCFDYYCGFELYSEIKFMLFLPTTKNRSKTLSFDQCIMEIAPSIPWKAVKIGARDTKRKKSEASSFKQFSQRLLDNEVFQHSLKILLWQKPKTSFLFYLYSASGYLRYCSNFASRYNWNILFCI